MKRWRWIALDVLYAVHDRQLAEHGGRSGVRDVGLLESALARPRNLVSYAKKPDAAALAAAYAYGLARNHGFVDGNKRVAWVTSRLFLADNGSKFHFDPKDAILLMENVAGGAVSESQLADWFRLQIKESSRKRIQRVASK